MSTTTQEIKSALAVKVRENQEIADSIQVVDGVMQVTEAHQKQFDANMAEIRKMNAMLESLAGLSDVKSFLDAPDGQSFAQKAAAMQGLRAIAPEQVVKSLGRAFLDSEEFKSLGGGRSGYNMGSPFEYKMPDMAGLWGRKDVYTASPTGTIGGFGGVQRDPLVDRAHNLARVRDLFPAQSTSAAVIEYFRVTGFTNNASVVPERASNAFALKPQSGLTFKGEQATVRTIAHWEAAHRNVLQDEPQLEGIINNELLYGLRLEEDAQILSGTGTGEDLLGILNTPNVQGYSWSSGAASPVKDTKADAIRRAATLAFLAYYQPTGVVVHPNDWEDMELSKDSTGRYLLSIQIATGAEPRIWNLPVIATPAIPEGTALVGSFGIGAQLYDREQATIRIAEQHADFFVRNAIVVLAEERLALATKRPESFVKVTFDSAPV